METLQKRIPRGTEIANKVKIDLPNAVIGSVFKYGISLLHIEESGDRKLQKFATKCLKQIAQQYRNTENDAEENELSETPTVENKNIDLRRECNVHTAHPQLHFAKIGDI